MAGRGRVTARPILLTGATGQIGGALRPLLARLAPVVAPGRETLDLADPDSIRRAVDAADPALIVNAAAFTEVDRAETEPEAAMAVNGMAPGILAEEARRLGAPLVQFSTDYVFDGAKAGAYRETDACAPLNAYGRSKLAGERAVAAAGGTYLILRTSWVYSRTGRGFLSTILRLLEDRPEIRVVDDQRGAPSWAEAVARATARVLAEHWRGVDGGLAGLGGLYHLSAAGETTWCGFARAIAEAAGRDGRSIVPISSAAYGAPARRPANSVLDNGRFAAAFGFSLAPWRDQLSGCMAGDGDGQRPDRYVFADA